MDNPKIILPKDTLVYRTLDKLATEAKVVCFSGLPAVGKSLYIQQFSYLSLAKGRNVTTMQWDLARQAFETEELLAKYPEIDGITHSCIRKACGWWARNALYEWFRQNEGNNDILIIEAPLIGNRLVEFATPMKDDVESFLRSRAVQFVVPIPTEEVRLAIEAKRKKSSATPSHEQEKADANPYVMMVLYKELSEVALKLGYQGPANWYQYKPELYEFVYTKVLRHRNFVPLHIEIIIESNESVYSFPASAKKHLIPRPEEVSRYIDLIELQFQTTGDLESSVDDWYLF